MVAAVFEVADALVEALPPQSTLSSDPEPAAVEQTDVLTAEASFRYAELECSAKNSSISTPISLCSEAST